ncbi:Monooxygenase 2 [Linum grandiflorum]
MAAELQQEEEIVIVGAGIAGLATSLALHRLGIRSLVLESSSILRITGFSLGVWGNAWKALDALGLGDALRQQHQLLDGMVAASTITKQTTAQLSFIDSGHELRCVQRKLLLEAMVNELPDGSVRYSSKVVSMEESGCFKLLHLVDGTVIKTKVLIGCDGVNSTVAKWIGMNEPVVSDRLAARGSAIFPQGHGFASKLFMFAGKGFRAGCIPCNEKIMYWFFSWTPSIQERDLQDNPSRMKEYLLTRLQNSPEMTKVVENTELDSMMTSPLRYRHPSEFLWKKLTKDNVCVAGDALHPMTPDLGQGGCAALEDSVTLGRCLAEAIHDVRKREKTGMEEEYGKRIQLGLNKYVEERRWRSLKLVTAACLVGIVQQGEGKIVTFLRDRLLANFLAGLALKIAEFDCGKLT